MMRRMRMETDMTTQPTTGPSPDPAARVERVTLAIHDLGCGGGGADKVERALARTPGVNRAYVNPFTEMAYVDFDPDVCPSWSLVAVVERAGYHASTPESRPRR